MLNTQRLVGFKHSKFPLQHVNFSCLAWTSNPTFFAVSLYIYVPVIQVEAFVPAWGGRMFLVQESSFMKKKNYFFIVKSFRQLNATPRLAMSWSAAYNVLQ